MGTVWESGTTTGTGVLTASQAPAQRPHVTSIQGGVWACNYLHSQPGPIPGFKMVAIPMESLEREKTQELLTSSLLQGQFCVYELEPHDVQCNIDHRLQISWVWAGTCSE